MFIISQKYGEQTSTVRIGYSHPKSEGNGLYLTSVTESSGGRRTQTYYTNTGYVTQDLGSLQNTVTFNGIFPIWSNLKQTTERIDRFPERTVIRRELLPAYDDFELLYRMQYRKANVIIQEKIGEDFFTLGGPNREYIITNIQRERTNYTLGKFNYLNWSLTLKAANDHIESQFEIIREQLNAAQINTSNTPLDEIFEDIQRRQRT